MAAGSNSVTRHVEWLRGSGSVWRDGSLLGSSDYDLDVWQDFVITLDGQELPGQKELRTIRLSKHTLNTFKIALERATLTLRLEDGRQVAIIPDGSGFRAAGPLK
jgi:hypothetical protein